MTPQELADEIQNTTQMLRSLLNKAEITACTAAAKDPSIGKVVAELAKASGHAAHIHAHTTRAAMLMPDATPKFGGK